MDYYLIGDLVIAYCLDLLLGDPIWLYHPVRVIGGFIRLIEQLLRKFSLKLTNKIATETTKSTVERCLGIILTLIIIGGTFGAVLLLLEVARWISPVLYHLVNIYFLYTAFATRCLADEVLTVHTLLKNNDLAGARCRVGMLVGRETDRLSQTEITRAVVETTAENTVDGIISPLIYASVGALLGIAAPLVYAFKATSTLDSMVGYKNEKYLHFGWASAKLDDTANYLPARLSGLLIPLGALLAGQDFQRSWRVMVRDRKNHASPNCAYPEAAVAGALGVQLGGSNSYFGQLVPKPTIGDMLHSLEAKDILSTVKIMLLTSLLTMIICGGALVGVLFL